jgi:hypothetical protein
MGQATTTGGPGREGGGERSGQLQAQLSQVHHFCFAEPGKLDTRSSRPQEPVATASP